MLIYTFFVDNVEVIKALEFLNNYIEPNDRVWSSWKVTAAPRQDEKNKNSNVLDYLNKYPCLFQPIGHHLVNIIFL